MDYEVIIIGAGASGLTAAVAAARQGSSVLVIEQKDKAGKKILATGNGKCNFTNTFQKPECYRSDDSAFAMKVLSCFDVGKTIQFFRELGIYPKNREGYLYPNSEQAASMVQVLLMECERLKVAFCYGEAVKEIRKPDYTVVTETFTCRAEALILATGGCASPQLGSDGSGYQLAESLGHRIIKPLPALVQLKSPVKFLKTISGVRTVTAVSAHSGKKVLAREEGEVLFTDYGISGIPVLQLSRYVAKALDRGEKVQLLLDFMPELTREELEELMKQRRVQNPHKNLEEMMIGLYNHKLSYIMIKEAGLEVTKSAPKVTDEEIRRLVYQMKEFLLPVCATNTFENAQVTAGGAATGELNEKTLESKLHRRLYLTGELVDVDGTCGGYNLQWAWSTGYLAGTAAGRQNGDYHD